MDKRTLGRWGEAQAAKYLKKNGYSIVDMNYSCRLGEIDIIGRRKEILAFVEVKLRRDDSFAYAREFVTQAKQRRIKTAAQLWLSEHELDLQPRFDVVEIYAPQGERGELTIEHIENAFE